MIKWSKEKGQDNDPYYTTLETKDRATLTP